jgi:hypothetical protein
MSQCSEVPNSKMNNSVENTPPIVMMILANQLASN